MFGALSNTEDVRESADTDEFVGWYARDIEEGCLRVEARVSLNSSHMIWRRHVVYQPWVHSLPRRHF